MALGQAGADVCVVDLDLAFGDVAITMQLIPEHTIAEAADSEEHLDFAMLQTLLTRHPTSVMILAAPTHPEGRDRIAATLVRRVIQTLRRNFDFVVIDTPPGFDDQVLGAFDETDECIVVATLDVPTIKNTKVAMETLDLLRLVPNNRHLVLNRADEEVGLSLANVEEILGMKVAISLPSATAVASATNHGQPIVLSKPEHPVSKAINTLARQVGGDSPALRQEAPSAKRGLFGRQKKVQEAR
jgi:pilus assembly protein CpaE